MAVGCSEKHAASVYSRKNIQHNRATKKFYH